MSGFWSTHHDGGDGTDESYRLQWLERWDQSTSEQVSEHTSSDSHNPWGYHVPPRPCQIQPDSLGSLAGWSSIHPSNSPGALPQAQPSNSHPESLLSNFLDHPGTPLLQGHLQTVTVNHHHHGLDDPQLWHNPPHSGLHLPPPMQSLPLPVQSSHVMPLPLTLEASPVEIIDVPLNSPKRFAIRECAKEEIRHLMFTVNAVPRHKNERDRIIAAAVRTAEAKELGNGRIVHLLCMCTTNPSDTRFYFLAIH